MSQPRKLSRRQFIQLSAGVVAGAAFAPRGGPSTPALPTRKQTTTPTATWPTLPAFSANNFLDHFTGASLDARWTAVTGGTGSVTVTDGCVDCNCPVATDSAFIYFNTKLDKTKSQLWTACVNSVIGGPSDYFFLINQVIAPTADTDVNWDLNVRIRGAFDNPVSSQAFTTDYFDSSHIRTSWEGVSTQSWTTSATRMYEPTRNDDYYILGFETDGPNAMFRLMGWCQTYTGGYTYEQGLRMFGLTDWVHWSTLETSTDLWLCLGNPYTNNGNPCEFCFEWVRYAENNAPIEGWCNQKSSIGTYAGGIRHLYSHDGIIFVPQDRTTVALQKGADTFEDNEVTEPWVVSDGATDYLFYTGSGSVTNGNICVAKAAHATPQVGPWTRGASNPILAPLGAGQEATLGFPCVIQDLSEPDSNKRWKMLYSGWSSVDNHWRLFYATAPDPPDTSTWTRQGLVLNLGTAGQSDSTSARDAVIVWYDNQWEVWYEGADDDDYRHLMRATGTDLASLTKDGAGSRLQGRANGNSTLTANLTGRTVTVASTAGFVADGMVAFDQDASLDDYGVSRIRKVLSATQVELYHGLDGFTTTTPAKMKQLDACKYFTPRYIGLVGNEWWFYLTNWEPFSDEDASKYGVLLEQMTFHKHSNAAPSGARPAMQMLESPVTSRGFNNDQCSVENMTLLMMPVMRGQLFLPFVVSQALPQSEKPMIGTLASDALPLNRLGT